MYFGEGDECIQERITSSKCYADSGQFCKSQIHSANSENKRNFLLSSSIDLCSDDSNRYPGGVVIDNLYGIHQLASINITSCKTKYTGAINIIHFFNQSFLVLSNIINNTAGLSLSEHTHSMTAFSISKDESMFKINRCSYFSNKQLKANVCLIDIHVGLISISQCCFSNNSVAYTFDISTNNARAFVYECFIDKIIFDPSGTKLLYIEKEIIEEDKCFFRWQGNTIEEGHWAGYCKCDKQCTENFFKYDGFMMNLIMFTAFS